MVLEELIHCQTCTRALKVGEIAWITSRPGVPHTIDEPVLLNLVATVVIPPVHGVRVTLRELSMHGAAGMVNAGIVGAMRRKKICLHPLLYDLIPINRVSHNIICPVKNDGGNDTAETAHGRKGFLPLLDWIWPTIDKNFSATQARIYPPLSHTFRSTNRSNHTT